MVFYTRLKTFNNQNPYYVFTLIRYILEITLFKINQRIELVYVELASLTTFVFVFIFLHAVIGV